MRIKTNPDVPPATACQLILGNPNIEFGRINPYDLKASASPGPANAAELATVGSQIRTLHVSCNTPTRFALRFQAPADAGNTGYQMGKRGLMLLKMTHARADGKPALLTVNPAPVASPATALEQVMLAPHQSLQAALNGQLTAFSHLSVQVEIEGKMKLRTQGLKSDRDFSVDGYFELVPL